MNKLNDLLDQKNLDDVIAEFGYSKYENAIASGVNDFINSCSESICKEGNSLSDHYIHSLLYLLKYLHKFWPDLDKEVRLNKQLCLKTLFVILLTGKQISECRYLLEQSVSQIANCWEVTPDEYPFLAKEEEGTVLSEVQAISERANVHAEFSSLNFERTDEKTIFNYCPDRIYDELIEIYEKFCCNCGLEKNDERFPKAIFIAVRKQFIFNALPGILNILPLQLCIVEARRLLFQNPEDRETKCMNSLRLESNFIFTAGHRLLIKRKTTERYDSIPAWARWFFLAGQKIAAGSTLCRNLIIGLSLPTRSYAVQFFLLGYETWKVKKIMADQNENSSYFNHLAECEENEALLIWENGHWLRCWFKGVGTIEEEKYIKVEVSGSERRQHLNLVVETNIAKLRKAVDSEREVAVNQTGFGMSGLDSLISYYNKTENDILKFLIKNESSYAVVGSKSTIKNELEKEKLYLYQAGEYIEFSLQHILRFENLMTDYDLPRGKILNSRPTNDDSSFNNYPVVIYDGSLAYLNRQGDIQSNVEIVLLDRTEPQFSSARNELMVRYYDRSVAVDLFDDVPVSIELIAFKE